MILLLAQLMVSLFVHLSRSTNLVDPTGNLPPYIIVQLRTSFPPLILTDRNIPP
jgi:hypothetical protein